ncbi:hypothetical protein BGZ95_005479 [Linnemannia exigua]|uniref:Crinkler effector protein N-terminal domain-containing protein n=1 Tax=Linnemannia exigua TaxID=604196 RepID=A0AAD4D1V4_9FUNG|nr:hypothetical protein BGZ95_005479 [Linnemannia exigua]
MTNDPLTLFCLVDGDSTPFSVDIDASKTVDHLKDAIKLKKPNDFNDVDADVLTLWRVSIPVAPKKERKEISLADIPSKEELDETDDLSDVFEETPPKKTIHVIVQRPPPARSPPVSDYISQKRPTADELDLPANKKIRITEGWRRYTASDGKAVDLPPSWIGILANTELEPEPRAAFDHLKDDLRAGDAIIVPSMGQTPKEFGRHGQGRRLFVTEQMLELWEDMRGDQEFTYRRVLSGPMGVGKSYLSYFLAARAYAEGWLVLYLSDAEVLDKNKQDESALQVVKRFLAMNKDILTGAELEILVRDYNGTGDILTDAASLIFQDLLMSRDRKTLLLVDEHGKLFEKEPYVPDKFKSLVPLKSYHWWGEDAKGSRVVFTGTAHAKYEMSILDESYRPTSVVFVGPLSRHVFSKLLDTYRRLAAPAIRDEVTAITNCVPRELVYLSAAVEDLPEPISLDDLHEWTERRTKDFLLTAKTYYESRTPFRKNDFYKALLQTFLGSTSTVDFEWDFLDLGLIYRNLNGSNPTTIALDFSHCDTLKIGKTSLGSGHENVLTRGYEVYPRFDFMLGPLFIQASISDFGRHNTGSADLSKAFNVRDDNGTNQIERYLNDLYGPDHYAEIEDNKFVVTRDGVPVPGFRVVYIRGSPGKPSHRDLVKKFPDVRHISFEEVRENLFKNIVT